MRNTNKSVLTLTVNPAIDATYTLQELKPGQTHRVQPGQERAGGKGINVARVLHTQGARVFAITTAGGAAGAALRRDLEQSQLQHRVVPVTAETRRSIAFVDGTTKLTSIFNETGAELLEHEWDNIHESVTEALSGVDGVETGVLVVSGSLPPNAPHGFYAGTVTMAHARGIPTIVDATGQQLVDSAKAGADLVKPNHHELMDTMQDPDLPSAARKLLRLGAKTVLVSAGADGMCAFTRDDPGFHLRARLPRPLNGNPTGAGDAAVAAAALSLCTGATDTRTILRAAAAWGSAAVLMPFAGEISPKHHNIADQLEITREKDLPCP